MQSSARPVSIRNYLSKPFAAALLLTALDSLGLLILKGYVDQSTLVLLLFLEGGGGLLAGAVISLSSTPSVSRIGQSVLGTAPWSKEAEKHAERVGWKWMLTSAILVSIGFILSIG